MKTLTINYEEKPASVVGHGSGGGWSAGQPVPNSETLKNVLQWNFFGNIMVIDLEGNKCEVRELKYIKSYSWVVEPANRVQRRKK